MRKVMVRLSECRKICVETSRLLWKLGKDTLHTDTSLYVNICTRA